MITKTFAVKVADNSLQDKNLRTVSKSGTEYFADFVAPDSNDGRLPGVYVYKVHKEDPEYNEIVAVYRLGIGWYICG